MKTIAENNKEMLDQILLRGSYGNERIDKLTNDYESGDAFNYTDKKVNECLMIIMEEIDSNDDDWQGMNRDCGYAEGYANAINQMGNELIKDEYNDEAQEQLSHTNLD